MDFAAQHHSAIQRLHVDVHNTARHHVSKMVGITLSLSCRVDGFNAMGLHRGVQVRHDGGALCAAFVFPLWLWKILDLNDIWVLYLWRVVARLHSGGLQAQVSIALLRCSLRGQTRIQVIFNSTAFASYYCKLRVHWMKPLYKLQMSRYRGLVELLNVENQIQRWESRLRNKPHHIQALTDAERERENIQDTYLYRLRSHKLDFPPSVSSSVSIWKERKGVFFSLRFKFSKSPEAAFVNRESIANTHRCCFFGWRVAVPVAQREAHQIHQVYRKWRIFIQQ